MVRETLGLNMLAVRFWLAANGVRYFVIMVISVKDHRFYVFSKQQMATSVWSGIFKTLWFASVPSECFLMLYCSSISKRNKQFKYITLRFIDCFFFLMSPHTQLKYIGTVCFSRENNVVNSNFLFLFHNH